MGQGYSYAIEHIESEFVKVQKLQGRDEAPRRNITYQELRQISIPDDLKVNLDHVAILYCLDANRDGVFSYDDLVAFAMWVASNLPNDVTTGEFSDAVQARCVIRLWNDCKARSDDVYVKWFCVFLERASPIEEGSDIQYEIAKVSKGKSKPTTTMVTLDGHPNYIPPIGGSAEIMSSTSKGRRRQDAKEGNTPPPPRSLEGEEDEEMGMALNIPQLAIDKAPSEDNERDSLDEDGDSSTESEGTSSNEEYSTLKPSGPRRSRLFNLGSLQTMYDLLNVKEGYGLEFPNFCHILCGEQTIETATATTVSQSNNSFASKGPDVDLLIPEESVETFLSAFIQSYWNILQKLGLEVLTEA